MDRASDSGSEGWGFESLPAYQIKEEIPRGISSFISCCAREGTRMIKSQYAGGILLQPVQKLVATLIFARPPQGQKCKRVSSGVPRSKATQTSPVAVPCVRLAHGGASLHTDRCHSLRSLHLPPAALPSLPLWAATIPQSRLRKEVAY